VVYLRDYPCCRPGICFIPENLNRYQRVNTVADALRFFVLFETDPAFDYIRPAATLTFVM